MLIEMLQNLGLRPATLLKRDSGTGDFLWILPNFRTPPAAASVHFTKYGLIQLGNPYINFEKPRETRRPAKELSPK